MAVQVKTNPSWLSKQIEKLNIVALSMATDVHREAVINAPVDKGNLVASGRVEKIREASYRVSFGGNSGGVNVPYAKRRHYENKKHPQTLRYLEKAGESVAQKKSKYLKGLK